MAIKVLPAEKFSDPAPRSAGGALTGPTRAGQGSMLSAVGVVDYLFGELTSATLEGNTIRGQSQAWRFHLRVVDR